jgi:di/tricarboxylate transporter
VSHSTITFLVLAAVVVVFVADRVPVAVVAVGTALSLWATGVLDVNTALAGFGDPAVLFIASLFVVSESLDATGVTAWGGQQLVARVADSRTRLLVLMLLLVSVLTALISNMATALIVIPIALETAKDLDVSARPVLMCVTVSAAAALITPVATPANLMVMEPGGYRFSDYWKLGLPLLVLYGVVAVGLVRVFWRF